MAERGKCGRRRHINMPHIENIFMSASNADAIDKVRNRHPVVEPLHAQKETKKESVSKIEVDF